ncbi:MBL fold metallo-hydrolase [Maritalea sp.]|uniref:MBL fold metallo-hydrolase n=1 Tax=Maritalea sp. TaxID=2003361 RepID=UPI003EF0A53A
MLTKREFLKLFTAAGLAIGLPSIVRAQTAATLSLGNAKLHVINDGFMQLPMGFVYGSAPQAERDALLIQNGLALDAVSPPCNVTVLETDEGLIVFDVGGGTNFLSSLGGFFDAFIEAGFDPERVTDVVFTHAHPDHLWGIIDDFDEVIFPEAKMHIARSEFDFWMDKNTISKMNPERQSFAVGAKNRLGELADRFSFFEFGDEILGGIEAVDTSGHTIGHTSFVVHGGDQPTMILGDALTHPIISFEKPNWPTGSDHDMDQGIATRLKLLDRLSHDQMRVIGYHLTNNGVGRVEQSGTAFRFVGS